MQIPIATQQTGPGTPLQRRSALAVLGLLFLPATGQAARAAEARLGRKVARAVGQPQASRMVRSRGADVAALDSAGLEQRCAADFREGRTLIVGGVLVAETEAVGWLMAAGFRADGSRAA
jgi:hypothetical protein